VHALADATVKHPYTPVASTPQHAPVCGGQVMPAQLVPTPWNTPPALVHWPAFWTM
jgi:hypothetical protein